MTAAAIGSRFEARTVTANHGSRWGVLGGAAVAPPKIE
jgi:hypothetical protein